MSAITESLILNFAPLGDLVQERKINCKLLNININYDIP